MFAKIVSVSTALAANVLEFVSPKRSRKQLEDDLFEVQVRFSEVEKRRQAAEQDVRITARDNESLRHQLTRKDDEIAELQLQLKQMKNAHVGAAESLAVAIFGPESTPTYDGQTIHGSWWAFAVNRVDRLVVQRTLLRNGLAVVMPYVDAVLRTPGDDDDMVLRANVSDRGLGASIVVRRRDVRGMKVAYENAR